MIAIRRSVWVWAVIILVLFLGQSAPAAVPVVEWTRQFGTAAFDEANSVSADPLGNIFVGGAGFPLGGGAGSGQVRLYDTSGSEQWTRLLPYSYGGVNSVSADGLGNAYAVGVSSASANPPTPGGAYVAKYNSLGDLQWSTLFDDPEGDVPASVSADQLGNVYVAGTTINDLAGITPLGVTDAFVRKYDSDGNVLWTRQLGSYIIDPSFPQGAGDLGFGVTTKSDGLGNVFLAGRTEGDLEGSGNFSSDGFVAKYDPDGNFQWVRQFEAEFFDAGRAVAVDGAGNSFVAGSDGGPTLPGFTGDQATLRKFDADGNLLWLRALDSNGSDSHRGVVVDALGGVFVTGIAAGEVGGSNSDGGAFVSKYDNDGNLLWTKQFGTAALATPASISLDGEGGIYAAGTTSGSFFGMHSGRTDAFLVKLHEEVPEPTSWTLMLCGTAVWVMRAKRARR